jgi:transglutaminase-like putative cysteine protease
MTRTGWTGLMAALLVVCALGVFVTRRATADQGGTSWLVTITARGTLEPNQPLYLSRAPDFRRQHVFNERFTSAELTHHISRKKYRQGGSATWHSTVPGGVQDFALSYTFRCNLPRDPADGRRPRAEELDRAPDKNSPTRKPPEDKVIAGLARRILDKVPAKDDAHRIRALYDLVTAYGNITYVGKASPSAMTARACLIKKAGDQAGKSRLLVALFRSQGLPARVVTGIALSDDPNPPLLHWVEVWDGNTWQDMDPTEGVFGSDLVPANRLILALDEVHLFRPRAVRGRLEEITLKVDPPAHRAPSSVPLWLRTFWRTISFASLRPGEQQLARFLVLLPLAALIVCVFRSLIGVPTFGTFSPALLGLAFLNLRALPWGLGIFFCLVMVGWMMRHWLERFHLLQVPRTSALLTLIVFVLLALVVVASQLGVATTQYVALFPLVILTHLVERFWTVEAEDGTGSSFKRLLGTAVVTVCISVCLAQEPVAYWMTRYPETLGVVLAVQLLLGRYTGYRLSELYRFAELYKEGDAPPPSEAVDHTVETNGTPIAHREAVTMAPARQSQESSSGAGGAS